MRLERFRAAKAAEVAALRRAADAGALPPAWGAPRPDFVAAHSCFLSSIIFYKKQG